MKKFMNFLTIRRTFTTNFNKSLEKLKKNNSKKHTEKENLLIPMTLPILGVFNLYLFATTLEYIKCEDTEEEKLKKLHEYITKK